MRFFPKKQFGQHFLRSQHVAKKIISHTFEAMKNTQSTHLIEIGPGKGALTRWIFQAIGEEKVPFLKHYLLIETDLTLKPFLNALEKKHLSQNTPLPSTEIQCCFQDFLTLESRFWISQTSSPITILSNLPYFIATAILEKLHEEGAHQISSMFLMFPKDIATRLLAPPNHSHRGWISTWLQNTWEVKSLFHLRPSEFFPPPKIDSSFLKFTPKSQLRIPLTKAHPQKWKEFLYLSFRYRRKTLRKSFKMQNMLSLFQNVPQEVLKKRAQMLLWNEWEMLFQCFLSSSPSKSSESTPISNHFL